MKGSLIIKKALIGLLALLMLFLTACGRERPPLPVNPVKPAEPTPSEPVEPTGADWRTTAREMSDEIVELPAWPYDSPAVDFVPSEGIRITAEAGSLYDDTVITMAPVSEDSERLIQIAEEFKEIGEPLVAAWEVHAGLEEDEVLPGEYTVSIDLTTLGIDETLWPAIRLYRLSDDGKMSEYNTTLEGSILTYSSCRNSLTLASLATCFVVGIALGLPIYYGIEKIKADWYYWDWTGASYHNGKTKYGNYVIKWRMKDVDPDQEATKQRMQEIADSYVAKAEEDYRQETEDRQDTSILYRMFNENKSVADRLKEYVEKDPEYKKLAASLKLPKLIKAVDEAIQRAYAYLGGEVFARMPKDDLTFRLKRTDGDEPEDTYGNSVATMLSDSYIEINVDKIIGILNNDEKSKLDQDNMLLTITHELFHICQERYHFRYLTDSIRFDEMTAVVLEADAKEYYKEKKYITTDPELTRSNYWGTLRLPIDDSVWTKLIMRHQGYLLSELVFYLREKTGQKPDGVDIYRCRSFHKKPVTSEPLMAAFKLSEVTFDRLFRQFCVDHVRDFTGNFTEDEARKEYNLYPREKLVKDKGIHVSLSTDGSYSAGVRCFEMYDASPLPLLMIMDKDLAAQHPEANLVPGETYVSTRNGAYLPGPDRWIGASMKNRLFLEVYGKLGPKTGTTAGYTVWPMDAPDVPKLACADGALNITFPEPRGAAKEGLLDGLVVKIASSDGKKTEKEFGKALMGKTVSIPLRELLEDNTKEAELTVSMAEFVYSTKDKALPGRFSKDAKIKVAYEVKGTSYRYNSTTMVNLTAELAHPALRDAFEKSTLFLNEDGTFTISGSGQAVREPEDDYTTVEGSATAQFTITGKWDAKKGQGTATISGSVTYNEKYTHLKETITSSPVKDRDGKRFTIHSVDRKYREELTDYRYSFSGSGKVETATRGDLYKDVDGLVLALNSDWTREGKYEVWIWSTYDRTGDPSIEVHETEERELYDRKDHWEPWGEGWKICWTIGQHDPVLGSGTPVTPLFP
ncbi:MAG: hypothetical protein IJS38_02280 [Erysipelotrichaceae bacterium]|nr:hypothetical protein [Erysipelotrichaceae bacterium]